MPTKSFNIKTEEFNRRGRSMIQHKLRVLLKCYTVYDFSMNEDDKTFEFKRSVRRNGVKRNDPRQLDGKYELTIIDEETTKLTLWV